MTPGTRAQTTVGHADGSQAPGQLLAMHLEVVPQPRVAPPMGSAAPSALDLFQLASALALALLYRRLRA